MTRDKNSRHGVLLINLGSPDAPTTRALRRYLRQFLSDPRVVDISPLGRFLLVNCIIVPFRSPKSAHAYRQIWTEAGSPLVSISKDLCARVAQRLGPNFEVALGMRYGQPSIASAVESLCGRGVADLTVIPLFPQYASASTGSALECFNAAASAADVVLPSRSVGAFYDHPAYLKALVAHTAAELSDFSPDHLLFSYHGLPRRQTERAHSAPIECSTTEPCPPIGDANRHCYRAQCFDVTRRMAAMLHLAPGTYSTSFQSRLGRTPWIEPYTDLVMPQLFAQGVRKLAVISPAFVADCLETLEEIDMRGKEAWRELGGEQFKLISCLNVHPLWVDAVCEFVYETVGR